jgi:hypothetical protein
MARNAVLPSLTLQKHDRQVGSIVEEKVKVKIRGKYERHFVVAKEKKRHLLKDSQASPARPSDKVR